MSKKESVGNRQNRLKLIERNLEHMTSKEIDQQIIYLGRILEKKYLLSEITKRKVYAVMGMAHEKKAKFLELDYRPEQFKQAERYYALARKPKYIVGMYERYLAQAEKYAKAPVDDSYDIANRLEGKHAIPIAQKLLNRALNRENKSSKDISSRLTSSLAILSFALVGASIFFSASSITGNVISGYSSTTANISGVILFILALVFGFFYFKKKK